MGRSLLSMALSSLLLVSCTDVAGPPSGSSVMTAAVSGAKFVAYTPPNRLLGYVGTFYPGLTPGLDLSAWAPDTGGLRIQISLALEPWHGTGHYSLCDWGVYSDSSAGFYYIYSPTDTTFRILTWSTTGGTCPGEAVVESFDSVQHTVAGTFHFTAGVDTNPPDTLSVTRGVFNGTYLPPRP